MHNNSIISNKSYRFNSYNQQKESPVLTGCWMIRVHTIIYVIHLYEGNINVVIGSFWASDMYDIKWWSRWLVFIYFTCLATWTHARDVLFTHQAATEWYWYISIHETLQTQSRWHVTAGWLMTNLALLLADSWLMWHWKRHSHGSRSFTHLCSPSLP